MWRLAAPPTAVLALVTCTGAGPIEAFRDRVVPSTPVGFVSGFPGIWDTDRAA
jgi:hypothetical protein